MPKADRTTSRVAAALAALTRDTHLEARILLAYMLLAGKTSEGQHELSVATKLDHLEIEHGARVLAADGLARWHDGVLTLPEAPREERREG